jgi:hypothetical protein
MRLALQISGEFRLLHLCLPTLQKHLVDVFPTAEIDIFIHTWWKDEDELGDTPYKTRYLYGHGTGLSIFKPRGYYLEKLETIACLQGKSRATWMFYSILRANEARKEYETLTETKYDLVMRYRTDCIFNESLFAVVKPSLVERKSFLCIPKPLRVPTADGPIYEDESASICDWFAIGTPDTMDIYCSTYLTFQDFDVSIVPESMLAMQLKAHGINRETSLRRPPMDYFLVDSTGEIRGSSLTAGKESLKNPDTTEER